jgi:conjugative transposon TraM protein
MIDKLSAYESAARDSAKRSEAFANDPYISRPDLNDHFDQRKNNISNLPSTPLSLTTSSIPPIDPNEQKVNQKLDELYREINRTPQRLESKQPPLQQTVREADPQFSSDVQKLEQMMNMMQQGNSNDPEMEQLQGMLDKILDIQHPERVRDKIREESLRHKDQVFTVTSLPDETTISLIQAHQDLVPSEIRISEGTSYALPRDTSGEQTSSVYLSAPGFYGLDDNQSPSNLDNAIEAVVHDTQELMSGATVKLRLLSDIFINGRLIEKNQFIYGTCNINGERLTVRINSIRNNNSLFPVALSAYDLDGMEGIFIPGAITRDVAKQSSTQSLQGMQFISMDQSLEAQAANAGIQAASGLFNKKVKAVKVTVKAGYKILLVDQNII